MHGRRTAPASRMRSRTLFMFTRAAFRSFKQGLTLFHFPYQPETFLHRSTFQINLKCFLPVKH